MDLKHFFLPDLGEGLQEATVVEWHVDAGANVEAQTIIVSVETAKTVVDIPAPCALQKLQLPHALGSTLKVGEILFSYQPQAWSTSGVVGKLPETHSKTADTALHALSQSPEPKQCLQGTTQANLGQPLSEVQTALAQRLQTCTQVPTSTVFESVDIHVWHGEDNITLRLIQAIIKACEHYPEFNAHYHAHNQSLTVFEHLDLGIAADIDDALYMPTLKKINGLTPSEIQSELNKLKQQLKQGHKFKAMQPGFLLSNVGSISGSFATPLVIPPMVATLAVGSAHEAVLPIGGKPAVRWVLPLSLSFDHRVINGAKAVKMMQALKEALA